jgi:hypothetical protein
MKAFLVVLSLIVSWDSLAQIKIKNSDLVTYEENWCQGVIVLYDGTQLNGSLWYNPKIRVLNFLRDDTSETYTAETVQSFEYYDSSTFQTRKFFSLDLNVGGAVIGPTSFFELIKEFDAFAVVSLNKGLDLAVIPQSSQYHPGQGGRVVNLSEREEIYFLTPEGEGILILTLEANETKDGVFAYKSKRKDLTNMDEFKRMVTTSVFKQLKTYADDNSLSFKVKADFIKILDHYSTLIEKKNGPADLKAN